MTKDKTNKISETDQGQLRSVSPYKAGLFCLCPRCGEAPIYDGLLDVKEHCEHCDYDFSAADTGDGAQVFVILVLGVISVLVGVFLFSLGLPQWALLLILISFVIGGSIWMLRIFKALFIALQYYHDAGQAVRVVDDADTKEKTDIRNED